MKTYAVNGLCRHTGQRITIRVQATTTRHAKTVAYQTVRRPVVMGTAKQKKKPGR